MRRFDFAKLGRQVAEQQADLAIRVLTQTTEVMEREQQEWDAAHPEQVADREAWQAEAALWEQARAEGRVHRYFVPPKADNRDDGPFRDHWGHYEERIIGTDKVRGSLEDIHALFAAEVESLKKQEKNHG